MYLLFRLMGQHIHKAEIGNDLLLISQTLSPSPIMSHISVSMAILCNLFHFIESRLYFGEREKEFLVRVLF